MAQCQGPRARKKLFSFFTCIWQENIVETQLNVNPTRTITWLVGVIICCTFFNNNSPPPRQFLCNKMLLKKTSYSKGMLIKQIFELRRPGPPGHICTPITGCFHDKTIISKENFRVDCYSLLKYYKRQYTLLPPIWTKSLTKFNPKMQDFKRVLDLICKQKED